MVRFADIVGKAHQSEQEAPGGKKDRAKKKPLIDVSDSMLEAGYRERALMHYNALLEDAEEVKARVKGGQDIQYSNALSILQSVIGDGCMDEVHGYAVSMRGGYNLPAHIVSVTLGSLRLAEGLGCGLTQLMEMGLAAFYENIGMYSVPENILLKEQELDSEELVAIRRHPELSASLLGEMGSALQWVAQMALQVHERADGSGYPRGLRTGQIEEAASVIGLMDTYTAMIETRPYRPAHAPSEAVKTLIRKGKTQFPTRVLREFLNQISLFPVSTCVKLNNKSVGRVLATRCGRPLRPRIELLYNERGEKVATTELIDLSVSPLLHIVGTVSSEG